jgi:hypothetical protein
MMVNKNGIIIHKTAIRKEAERHVTMTFIKIESSCDSQGGCYNMFDLGYLGVDNVTCPNNYPSYRTERREILNYHTRRNIEYDQRNTLKKEL